MTDATILISEIIDALRRIFVALEGAPGSALCGIDMTGRQIVALLLINEHGPLTVSRLAALMSLKLAAVSAVLNRLDRLGLISRSYGTSDRRVVTIALTPTGAETAGTALAKMNSFMDAMELHGTQGLETIQYSLESLMAILHDETATSMPEHTPPKPARRSSSPPPRTDG